MKFTLRKRQIKMMVTVQDFVKIDINMSIHSVLTHHHY